MVHEIRYPKSGKGESTFHEGSFPPKNGQAVKLQGAIRLNGKAVKLGDVPELGRLLGIGGAAHPNEKRGRV